MVETVLEREVKEKGEVRGKVGATPVTMTPRGGLRPAYHAYTLLYLGFIAAPIVAGIDKFFHFLVNWDLYLSPTIAVMLPVAPQMFMLGVGVIDGRRRN